jgi:hypothetical protein
MCYGLRGSNIDNEVILMSVPKGIRFSEETVKRIEVRARKKGWSFSKWVALAAEGRLNNHKKKEYVK